MATSAHAARHHGVRNQGECDVRLLLHCDALAPQGGGDSTHAALAQAQALVWAKRLVLCVCHGARHQKGQKRQATFERPHHPFLGTTHKSNYIHIGMSPTTSLVPDRSIAILQVRCFNGQCASASIMSSPPSTDLETGVPAIDPVAHHQPNADICDRATEIPRGIRARKQLLEYRAYWNRERRLREAKEARARAGDCVA